MTSELATPTQWSNCDPAQLDISDNGTGWRWFSRKYQLVTIGKLVDLNNRLIIFADSYWILICGINLMPPWTLTFVLSRGGRHEGADWHKVGGQHRDCGRHQEHKPAAHLHCTSIIIHEYFFCSQLVSFFCCLRIWMSWHWWCLQTIQPNHTPFCPVMFSSVSFSIIVLSLSYLVFCSTPRWVLIGRRPWFPAAWDSAALTNFCPKRSGSTHLPT